jgi:hypothetical protein
LIAFFLCPDVCTAAHGAGRVTRGVRLALSVALALLFGFSAPASAQTTIGTVGLTAGWATFGQAVPQGAAPAGLQVGSLPTQTDVKTRWPDNSIRFAVVTVNAPASGTFPITSAAPSSGTFTPALPLASVNLVIGGVTYTAALPAAPSADVWLSGPLAYEGRSVVAPVAGGTPHPFLRVNFDTRVYSDGGGRVDVTVENVLDMTGATAVTYDVDIRINGVSRFSKAAVQHFYLTRWRKTFAIGTTTLAAVTPDVTPLNRSGALPPYLSLVANRVDAITDPSRYEILGSGALDTDMAGAARSPPSPTGRRGISSTRIRRSAHSSSPMAIWRARGPCTCAKRTRARRPAWVRGSSSRSISGRRSGTTSARRSPASTTSRGCRCRSGNTRSSARRRRLRRTRAVNRCRRTRRA